jgi:polysaccharide pyruvyl transferase WcaK-like protein
VTGHALVVNAYAIGNWGDTAIAEGVIGSLRGAGFDRVTVAPVDWRDARDGWRRLGADDVVPPLVSLTDARFLGRRGTAAKLAYALRRYALARSGSQDPAVQGYRSADVVVSPGGGYFGGRKAGANLVKCMNIRAAQALGRPAVVAGIGVNPPSRTVGRVLRWGLAGATVLVRDRPSGELLDGLGIPAEVVPDVALRADSLVAAAAARIEAKVTERGLIGWAPRGYRREHEAWGMPALAEERTLDGVLAMLSDGHTRLRFLAQVRASEADDDRQAIGRLVALIGSDLDGRIEIAPDPSTLPEAVSRYAGLDVLITSRLHAALFALAVGTPALAIGYEPKMVGVMSELGLPDRVLPADASLTAARLTEAVARVRSGPERDRTIRAFHDAASGFAALDRALDRALARAVGGG